MDLEQWALFDFLGQMLSSRPRGNLDRDFLVGRGLESKRRQAGVWANSRLVTNRVSGKQKRGRVLCFFFFFFFFPFIFISWRLITLQYCSGFCHTLTWISHGFTCVPHPDPPSHLPLHPIPLGLPSAPGLSTWLMHPTRAGDLFHPWWYTCFDAVLLKHPTPAFSHRV